MTEGIPNVLIILPSEPPPEIIVFARFISSIKEERVNASKELNGPKASFDGDKKDFLEKIRKALYMSKICSYAQGFAQMRKASEDNEWNLKLGDLAMNFFN